MDRDSHRDRKRSKQIFHKMIIFIVFLPTHSIINHDGYAVKTAQLLSATGRVCTQRQKQNIEQCQQKERC